ncbi:MAG: ATP-binding protein [Methylacidiphilales bacterium]|nr:ATP-binding protein [Candidatus Methylacidiphilales bacterium]
MNDQIQKKGLFQIFRPVWYIDALLFWSVFTSCVLFMIFLLSGTTKTLLKQNMVTRTFSLTNMASAALSPDLHSPGEIQMEIEDSALRHLQTLQSENSEILAIWVAQFKYGKLQILHETRSRLHLNELLKNPALENLFERNMHAAQTSKAPQFSEWGFLKEDKSIFPGKEVNAPEYSFKTVPGWKASSPDEIPVVITAFDAHTMQAQFFEVDNNSGTVAGVAVLVATILGMFVRWRSMQRIQAVEEKLATMALLHQRDAILAEISSSADEILKRQDLEKPLDQMIFRIGLILKIDAFYASIKASSVFTDRRRSEPLLLGACPADSTPFVLSDLENPSLAEWKQQLFAGNIVCQNEIKATGDVLAFMRQHGLKSLALIPIRHENRLIGFLALKDQKANRSWEPAVLDSLKLAADLFGAAYARREQEQLLREGSKMQALGRMAGGVAHEFNNLLHIITGNLSRMLKNTGSLAEGHELAGKIMEASQRGSRIVEQLLSATRQGTPEFEYGKLNELVKKTAALIQPVAKKNIHLDLKLGEGLPGVLLDPSQIQQVILNLLLNACDAVSLGGRIEVRTGVCQRESGTVFQQYVFCEILDDGNGIPEADLEHIFDPFFTTKPPGAGTGLGLSTSRGILEQHHGFIEAANTYPHGARLNFYLPVHAFQCVTVEKYEGTAAVETLVNSSLLIADDEPLCLDVLGAYLKERDCKFFTAQDGNELLQLAEKHKHEIDWVITDWTMPGPEGPALVKQLRLLLPKARIVVASGFALNTSELPEVDGLIQKPFTPAQLFKTMRHLAGAVL